MVAIYDTPAIISHRLGRQEWVRHSDIAMGHAWSSFQVFHRNYKSSTIAIYDNDAISMYDIGVNFDFDITSRGLPIGSTRDPSGRNTLALSKDWLVHATTNAVRVFRYDETANEWTREGSDVLVDPGKLGSVRVAVGGIPGSPKVLVVGLPGKSVVRFESVYLNSTNLASFTNKTNLFTNGTGHVFSNESIVYESGGSVQLYYKSDT